VADYTWETVTRTIRRWIVPAGEPWGAPTEEISKAWAAAAAAYRDDAVVIEFTTEARAT
jgi:hypothetical protein